MQYVPAHKCVGMRKPMRYVTHIGIIPMRPELRRAVRSSMRHLSVRYQWRLVRRQTDRTNRRPVRRSQFPPLFLRRRLQQVRSQPCTGTARLLQMHIRQRFVDDRQKLAHESQARALFGRLQWVLHLAREVHLVESMTQTCRSGSCGLIFTL